MDSDTLSIIHRIGEILRNENGASADMLGSYIVGATLARDDWEEHALKYPLMDMIAEQGAELETLGDTQHADRLLAEIRETYKQLKESTGRFESAS